MEVKKLDYLLGFTGTQSDIKNELEKFAQENFPHIYTLKEDGRHLRTSRNVEVTSTKIIVRFVDYKDGYNDRNLLVIKVNRVNVGTERYYPNGVVDATKWKSRNVYKISSIKI